jgi:hypothetical protein
VTAEIDELESRFRALILQRVAELFPSLSLPDLPRLLDPSDRDEEKWLPIPGMYGGFSYRLEGASEDHTLIVDSWSRIIGGSGQRHLITPEETKLMDSGFV